MRRERVRALLDAVAAGTLDPSDALGALDREPLEELPFATIDHHRALRQGYPEVVLAQGKTPAQVLAICGRLAERGDGFLATRASGEVRALLAAELEACEVNELGRTVYQAPHEPVRRLAGTVLIVTAGTGDLPVAEEAAATATAFGCATARLTDVGVAGIHRVLSRQAVLAEAAAIIVVAGMDGALPSVVGGLVRTPVIAVPTSVGYGASFEGVAALLTMLNSCAAGVTVVNIDNGFGAAVAATRILAASEIARGPSA